MSGDESTVEAKTALREAEPDYQATIRQPRLQGPAALLGAMGMLDAADDAFEEVYAESVLTSLRPAVGGDEQLRRLNTKPLPDEDFDWDGIPDDVHERVDGVRWLCDACCDELFDTEYRTACRRLLSMAAAGDPNVFRRKGKPETAAAAVCWIIGKANDAFNIYGGLQVQELMAHFGIKGSVSQRARVILEAAGFEWRQEPGQMDLGTPELLASGRRAQIIELRDWHLADTAR